MVPLPREEMVHAAAQERAAFKIELVAWCDNSPRDGVGHERAFFKNVSLVVEILEASPGIEPGCKDLQSSA